MKAYKKRVKKKDLYTQFLTIINGLLNLSGKEAEVLSLLIYLQLEQQPLLGKKQDILSTDNRRLIMSETNINKNNLSKYLGVLRSRKILLEDEKGHYINDLFIPDIKDGISETLFVLEIKEDGK